MFRPLATAVLTVTPLVLTLVQPVPVATAAARRPDLVVSALSSAAEVTAGTTLRVRLTTKNRGRSRAAASITKVYLSADRRVGRDVAVGTIRVPRLKPGRKHIARLDLRVPARAAARNYRLLACADARRRVRESREGNNCRLATRAVQVTAADDGVPDFPLTPDPITVAPAVDESRAVEERVDNPFVAKSITATGADGTTYTLDIPAEALIGPETITLTPVTAVGGLPLSGELVAGVELKPHGLVLMKPATLTIDSPNLGPIGQQTPFYFHEGGEDFHLYPVLLPEPGDDKNVVRFQIEHFSTPGVGLGTAGDRAGVNNHPPARDQAQIAGAISDLIREAREADPNGDGPGDPDLGSKIEALMNAHYDGVIKPQLAAAEQNPRNDALVRDAIADALSWVRNMQLHLSSGDDPYSSARTEDAAARVERVLKAVYLDRWKRCSQDHELEVMPHLISIARQALLLGYSWGDAAWQRFLDCARFELRFDSRISFDGTWPVGGEQLHDYPHTGSGDWRAQATLLADFGAGTFLTQAPLSLTEWGYHSEYSYPRSDGTTCSGSTDQVGTEPGILHGGVAPHFEVNPKEVPPEGEWEEPEVDLFIAITALGVKDVTRTVNCAGGDYTETSSSRWHQQFTAFRNGFGSVSVTGKKADRSGDLLYAETWDHFVSHPNHLGSQDWSETTVLEVWHKPAT